jgi:group II intron reverse transcriptase/maturase
MQNDSLWSQVIDKRNFTSAWQRLRANMGAPGVDRITVEEFAANAEANLSLLRQMVTDHSYQPLPFLTFNQTKNKKQRTLHVPALRDRLVQYAVLQVIQPFLETRFSSGSFAYRPGKSAIKAAEKIERWIKKGHEWFYETDIENFFDSIDRTVLQETMTRHLHEEKLIKLAMLPIYMYNESSATGLPQGMVLSPILANLYLHECDLNMQTEQWRYLRYSDNILILSADENAIRQSTALMDAQLERVHLKLNPGKTSSGNIEKGFIFLGFHFDRQGRRPGLPAWQRLQENLSETLGRSKDFTKDKMNEKLEQIIRGWTNYFQIADDDPKALLISWDKDNALKEQIGATLLRASLAIKKGDLVAAHEALQQCREPIQSPEVSWQWGFICQHLGLADEAHDSFLAAMRENPDQPEAVFWLGMHYYQTGQLDKAIRFLQKAVSLQPQQGYVHYALGMALRQFHLDGAAHKCFSQAAALDPALQTLSDEHAAENQTDQHNAVFARPDLERLRQIFIGREDIFARQWLNADGRVGYSPQFRPLQENDWAEHLAGKQTLALYLTRSDHTSFHIVLDLDLNKQVRSEFVKKDADRDVWLKLVLEYAIRLRRQTDQFNMPGYIEESGSKGLHIWYFFSEPLPVKDIALFCKLLTRFAGDPPSGITMETFPRKDTADEKCSSLIKLPFGIHKASGRRCLFIDTAGHPYPNWLYPLPMPERISANSFYQALEKLQQAGQTPEPLQSDSLQNPDIIALFRGCRVLNFLKDKAEKEGRLSHLERLTFLGILGHMGETGKHALHVVMRSTINYNYRITERWSARIKASPLSCPKIRQWHQAWTPSVGCFCKFSAQEGRYPSPLLHCHTDYSDLLKSKGLTKTIAPDATTPADNKKILSVSIAPEPPVEIQNENHKPLVLDETPDIEQLVRQWLKTRKEERKLQQRMQDLQERLNRIFDLKNCEEIPTTMGRLRRVRQDGETSWLLEI